MFSDDCRDAFTKEQEKIKSPLESENSGIIKKEDEEISPDVKGVAFVAQRLRYNSRGFLRLYRRNEKIARQGVCR